MELEIFRQTDGQISLPALDAYFPVNETSASPMRLVEERLPFSVKIVRDEEDLAKAVSIRHSAYGRHIPEVAALLEKPEACDSEPGSVVLLAESHLDGSPLGTMRIQTNRYRQLALEQSVDLPAWLHGTSQAEATRLGVTNHRIGRLVKIALFKAYFQYCQLDEIDWMVIAARSPLDRTYVNLMFNDVFPGGEFVPMRHAGNIPHRVMALKVELVEPDWKQARHPLYGFFFHTNHPDIDLCGADYLPLLNAGIPSFQRHEMATISEH